MFTIERLRAWEILDSRGRPTVEAQCRLSGGAEATASVPSGASTGRAEAVELRDGDPERYRGLGCRRAVANIHEILAPALVGRAFRFQAELDRHLIELDGTPEKSRLGANGLLAVSIAFARAAARQRDVPLYRHFADLMGRTPLEMPLLTINLFSGGKHAGGQSPLQDVLLVPQSTPTVDEGLAMAYDVYQCAAELVARKYGMRLLRADEGGLAPPFPNAETMIEDAMAAIAAAGLRPVDDVALAIDVAATHFYRDGHYHLGQKPLESGELIEQLARWVKNYPVISLEDGLAEDDWAHWPELVRRLGQSLIVGDDLLCTNPARIQRAIDARAATALLLKVNQIGTLTEAMQACRLAREAGWSVIVSARSGETEDNWLADLAVGWGGDQIKIGSITQSERLSKYNRLLRIEGEMGG